MTILELKDGNFRYWFRSDVVPEPSYPVVGKCQANGGTVILSAVCRKSWANAPTHHLLNTSMLNSLSPGLISTVRSAGSPGWALV